MFRVCAAGALLFGLLVFTGCGTTTNLGLEPVPVRNTSAALPGLRNAAPQALPAVQNIQLPTQAVGPVNSKWYLDSGKWYADQD